MAGHKKLDTRELIKKIEILTKNRIAKKKVVFLNDIRDLNQTQNPYTVLIIEDDETIRHSLRRILEVDKYRVILAADGRQLSLVLDDSPIDLIMLDVGLPWINGFELAQMMKEHSDLKNIPLVFISGHTTKMDMERGFQVGANDYITKPFDIEKVRKTVNTLVRLNNE